MSLLAIIIWSCIFIFVIFMACLHEISEACKELDEVMQQSINKVNRDD